MKVSSLFTQIVTAKSLYVRSYMRERRDIFGTYFRETLTFFIRDLSARAIHLCINHNFNVQDSMCLAYVIVESTSNNFRLIQQTTWSSRAWYQSTMEECFPLAKRHSPARCRPREGEMWWKWNQKRIRNSPQREPNVKWRKEKKEDCGRFRRLRPHFSNGRRFLHQLLLGFGKGGSVDGALFGNVSFGNTRSERN